MCVIELVPKSRPYWCVVNRLTKRLIVLIQRARSSIQCDNKCSTRNCTNVSKPFEAHSNSKAAVRSSSRIVASRSHTSQMTGAWIKHYGIWRCFAWLIGVDERRRSTGVSHGRRNRMNVSQRNLNNGFRWASGRKRGVKFLLVIDTRRHGAVELRVQTMSVRWKPNFLKLAWICVCHFHSIGAATSVSVAAERGSARIHDSSGNR